MPNADYGDRAKRVSEALAADPEWQRQVSENYELVGQLAAFEKVLSALAFYGDPDTYFAIGFFPDPPCGELMQDFSEHGDPNYEHDDQRPGKRAREALEAWAHACSLPSTASEEAE